MLVHVARVRSGWPSCVHVVDSWASVIASGRRMRDGMHVGPALEPWLAMSDGWVNLGLGRGRRAPSCWRRSLHEQNEENKERHVLDV